MPGSGEVNRKKIIEAAQAGQLPMSRLDEVVTSLVAVVLKAAESRKSGARVDLSQHHALARRVAGESVILLKNEGHLLPLSVASKQKIAVIGAFAKEPRYQGAGSSQVNPTRISNAYDELVAILGGSERLSYASGYEAEGETTAQLLEEARQQAQSADVAIVFAGLPDSHESEGFDRSSLEMPEGHNRLIDVVSQAQPNTVVVLMNGSAITMPWVSRVKALLEGWLTGQAGGGAIADILTGRINPSAKLAETFPPAAGGHAHRHRVPRPQPEGPLRRRRLHRLPVLRQEGPHAAVPVRLRAQLHHLRLFGPGPRRRVDQGHRHADRPAEGEEHGQGGGEGSRPALRPRGEARGQPSGQGAQGLRQGVARAR